MGGSVTTRYGIQVYLNTLSPFPMRKLSNQGRCHRRKQLFHDFLGS
jgi:hypothetical protein